MIASATTATMGIMLTYAIATACSSSRNLIQTKTQTHDTIKRAFDEWLSSRLSRRRSGLIYENDSTLNAMLFAGVLSAVITAPTYFFGPLRAEVSSAIINEPTSYAP
mgnify:CR=1 FL=1